MSCAVSEGRAEFDGAVRFDFHDQSVNCDEVCSVAVLFLTVTTESRDENQLIRNSEMRDAFSMVSAKELLSYLLHA